MIPVNAEAILIFGRTRIAPLNNNALGALICFYSHKNNQATREEN